MFKSLPFIVGFSLLAIGINAQSTFQKNYGGPVLDWANSASQTSDSGYIILGTSKNFGAGLEDLFLIKTNQYGDTLWTRTFGGLDNEEGATVQQTTDGGYILSGYTLSFGTGGDIYLVKTDAMGDMMWSKNYGGSGFEYCRGVQQCFDGGYLINGYTNSYGAGNSDLYLIKTDANGDTLWTKTYGTSNVDSCFATIQTNDSGFVLTGTGFINGSRETYLIKTDFAGTIIWSKSYGGAGIDAGFSVIQTNDNGYCIAGTTTSFGAGAKDIYVIKTDANGDTLWSRTYGGAGSEEGNSILQSSYGGYLLTGYTNSYSQGDDLFIIKTDVWGLIEWAKLVGAVSNAKDEGRCVATTNDGGYIVAGFSQSNGNGTDVIFIKTDSLGSFGCGLINTSFITASPVCNIATPGLIVSSGTSANSPATVQSFGACQTNLICTPVSVTEQGDNHSSVVISPNPFSTTATLKIKGVEPNEPIVFTLTDMQGRIVSTTQVSNHNQSCLISANGLSAGMYFYQLSLAHSKLFIGSGKVVIE